MNKVLFKGLIILMCLGISALLFSQAAVIKKSDVTIVQIKPDLIIKSVTAGLKAFTPAGEKNGWVECEWDTRGTIPSKWALKLYVNGTEVGAAWINPGDPKKIRIPWQGAEGMQQIGCTLDWEYNINELNEKNNKMITLMDIKKPEIRIEPVKPDISILDVSFVSRTGGDVYAGMEVFYRCDWKREGPTPATDFKIKRYINGALIGTTTAPRAATSGAASSVERVPNGRSTLKCVVDTANQVPESNELNNSKTKQVKYSLPVLEVVDNRPDIIAKKVYYASRTAGKVKAGDDVFFRCDWKREGPTPTTDFKITRYIDGKLIGATTVPSAATSGAASSVIKAPAGKHELKCVVDYMNKVTESNENNNKIISRINLLPPLRVIKPSRN